jgi:hypothetical protein
MNPIPFIWEIPLFRSTASMKPSRRGARLVSCAGRDILLAMMLRLSLLLVLALALAPLRGQVDQPVQMHPPFPLALPLTNQGRMVTVKYPVMINQATVIKPGAQLRVCYFLNTFSQDPTDLALVHSGSLEDSYARDPAASAGAAAAGGGSSQLMHMIEGYRRTVWEVRDNFVLFLAQYPTESAHLIYSPTARDSDLQDEMFNFFDGLFVGSPSGKVTVLAVEKQSETDKAGLKAGDAILSVGGYPTNDDLMTFSSAYRAAKKDAKVNEAASYAMVVRSADGTTRTASVAMPLRLKGGLMDGFSDKP